LTGSKNINCCTQTAAGKKIARRPSNGTMKKAKHRLTALADSGRDQGC
jgi:hypothetical protein